VTESPPTTSAPTGDDGVIAERIERQIDTLLRLGRTRIRDRAASIHPRLNAQGFTVLSVLGRVDSMSQSELGERVGLDRTSLSKIVSHLQSLELIEQHQSPTDRRARVLQVSPEGRRKIDDALADRRATVWRNVADWPRADAEAFADLLARYNELSAR
jgi:DNA-binding MarR family transcriptional regulator